jgi:uncharacterized protein (DUF4415 family)
MKKSKNFPFDSARRISAKELALAKAAIELKTGKKRPKRGRPPKTASLKFVPTSIRLHPKVLAWAKREAKKKGVGYQTVINDFLLKRAV